MKKVYVNIRSGEATKERFEAISPEYEFVYKEDLDAEVVIGHVPPSRLKEFKNLKWVQAPAVGIDEYIKKGVLADGVILTNAADVHSIEVAEHALAAVLMMVKKIHLYHNDQKKHFWTDEGMVKQISRLKVCIVGLGNIGKHLAKQLKALGVYVIGVKRTMIDKPEYVDELYTDQNLKEAISDADVVVSVIPGNRDNEGLFTMDVFKAMRFDAVFINVGRGNLYQEEDLIRALKEKFIAGACIDVFAREPLPEDSPLWDIENLVITPHIAGSYHLQDAITRLENLAEENLRRYIKGEPLKNVISEREE